MSKVTTKALYLFLCSILGMLLFAMLHRAIFVLYDLVLIYDFQTYSLGLTEQAILAIDFFTMLIALFLGGWYGVALGIDWYSRVYGPNAEVKPGVFHGFLPHTWRGDKSTAKPANSYMAMPKVSPPVKSVTTTVNPAVQPIRTATVKPTPPPPVTKSNVKVPIKKTSEWTFDDFFKATPAPKKRAVAKKTTAKKTARKATAK